MGERKPSGTITDGVATPERQERTLLWPKLGPYPTEVRETIRVLAEILGAPRKKKKGTPTSSAGWAARKIGVKKAALSEVKRALSDSQLLLHGHVLARWMTEHEGEIGRAHV